MEQRYRSKKNPDYVVEAFEVGTGPAPEWLLDAASSELQVIISPDDGCCCEVNFNLPDKHKRVVRGGIVYKHVLGDAIHAAVGVEFLKQYELIEANEPNEPNEPEHKNYTAMRLRRLVSYDIRAWIGNIDVLTLAKEAADEIDRLVSLVWAESKRANKAEDKAWHSDERIATLEARVQEETKRAEIAEAKLAVELRKREVEIKLTNRKAVTPNEIMAWVYKKMQEEKNNG